MSEDALEAIRVTAQRVHRFASDVERDPSEENRLLWRAALDDLSHMIRDARSAGCDTASIQAATGETAIGRFLRGPAPVEGAVTDDVARPMTAR